MVDCIGSGWFLFCADLYTLIANIVFLATVLGTYKFVVNPKSSPIAILYKFLFEEEGWRRSPDEARQTARQLSSITTILAGIALATVAFVTAQTHEEPNRIEGIGGVIMMLISAVLFFWGLGFFNSASIPSDTNLNIERMTNFKSGFSCTTFGVYLFFSGLLWSVSIVNPWYPIGTFVGYFILFAEFKWRIFSRFQWRK